MSEEVQNYGAVDDEEEGFIVECLAELDAPGSYRRYQNVSTCTEYEVRSEGWISGGVRDTKNASVRVVCDGGYWSDFVARGLRQGCVELHIQGGCEMLDLAAILARECGYRLVHDEAKGTKAS